MRPLTEAEVAAQAAEAAARAAREAEAARERETMRAQLKSLRAELEHEAAARASMEAALTGKVDALTAQAAKASPVVDAKAIGLGLTGFVQSDFTIRQSGEDQLNPAGAPLNTTVFNVRRARLRMTLDRWYVAGAFELDANTVNGPQVRPVGAEASLKWPGERDGSPPFAMGTLGLFKIPFGFEVMQSDRERLFMERSVAERALFPGEYDVGGRLMANWRFVRFVVAVQNGNPIGDRSFPLRDPNAAKDITGRVGVDTEVSSVVSVAAGFSGLKGTGFHAGSGATKSTVQWNDTNGNGAVDTGEIMVLPGASAQPSQNFGRFAIGGDLRLSVKTPLGTTLLYGEVYWAKNLDRNIVPADPTSFGRDFRELGYYAALTQDLGPHGIAGVRYDFYNPDADSTNQVQGAQIPTALSYQGVAITAALRAPAGRLIAEFDLNRNHVGRDLQGNPANLKDNAFIVRGQVNF